MFRKIVLTSIVCLGAVALMAQATLSSKDMVAITPVLPSGLDLPQEAKSVLSIKLGQIATQNGFGSSTSDFILTALVATTDKQATATAPPQFMVELEVMFYVISATEGVAIDQLSLQLKGVDRSDTKAMVQALNQIKPRSTQVKGFMDQVRTKIVEYYNTRIPALITKAQALAARNQYEQALEVLALVPESADQYPAVADQMTAIYLKMMDRDADKWLTDAKGKIALKEYKEALESLSHIDPSSSKFKEAGKLINQIRENVDQQEQRDIDAMWKMYDNQIELDKMRIEAARSVGEARAEADSKMSETLNKWYMEQRGKSRR